MKTSSRSTLPGVPTEAITARFLAERSDFDHKLRGTMLFYAHSGLRYLVLLSGIMAVGYAAYGAAKGIPYDKKMRILASAFAGTVDLNVLLGIALIMTRPFYAQLGGHIAMMLPAAIVAHIVPAVMKRRPMNERTYMPHIVATVVALGLVAAGIMAIGRPIVG